MNNEQIKQILEKEMTRLDKEIKEHFRLYQKKFSNNQKTKWLSHSTKKCQTIKIAKCLGFEYCKSCGGLK